MSRLTFGQHLVSDRKQVLMETIQHRACVAFPQHLQGFWAQAILTPDLLHVIVRDSAGVTHIAQNDYVSVGHVNFLIRALPAPV